jgi:hypothetical protein
MPALAARAVQADLPARDPRLGLWVIIMKSGIGLAIVFVTGEGKQQ